MEHNQQARGGTPSAVVSHWLDWHLADALTNLRLHHRKHMLCITAGATSLAGICAFSMASIRGGVDTWPISMAANASLLAIAASLVTAVAFYPVMGKGERWLMRAVSTISHDNIEFLSVLGKLTELRNGETAGHNLRVALYTLMFAEALNLSPREIVRAVKGAMLHDVGKLAVPDSVLGKPGPLTPGERLEMNKHVGFGMEIISQSIILQEAAAVVGSHHERYDGQGYPVGLKGDAIPREARLFALVDVFDALTTRRVYKCTLDIDEALSIMATGRGSHFDPVFFDHFVELMPGFARRLPEDETALTMLLMDRLRPYFKLFVLEREKL